MKKILFTLLIAAGCSATTNQETLTERVDSTGGSPVNSVVAKGFVDAIENGNFAFPNGETAVIITNTLRVPSITTFVLESVYSSDKAVFSRWLLSPNGIIFKGYVGMIISNDSLYFAAKKINVPIDSDFTSLELGESRDNVDMTKVAIKNDGTPDIIATKKP
ncbi:MAG: hypothetical protein ACRC9L_02410 [Brevinema sp.]